MSPSIAVTSKNSQAYVTVTAADGSHKQLMPKFKFDSYLLLSALIVNNKGLILHSYGEIVWFDLDSGDVIAQHSIDRPVAQKYTTSNNRGCSKAEEGEAEVIKYHYYCTTSIWNDGNQLYVLLNNFNESCDLKVAKINHQGGISAMISVLSQYRQAVYIHSVETQMEHVHSGDLQLTLTLVVNEQPQTAVYNLSKLLTDQ